MGNQQGPGAGNEDIEHEEMCDDKYERCNKKEQDCLEEWNNCLSVTYNRDGVPNEDFYWDDAIPEEPEAPK